MYHKVYNYKLIFNCFTKFCNTLMYKQIESLFSYNFSDNCTDEL